MNRKKRLLIIAGVALLHPLVYYPVNIISSHLPSSVFYNFQTAIDGWIPYLSWTWFFYYIGDLYIFFFAAYVVWKLPEKKFLRAVYAYIGMIIIAALIQIALPAESSWPRNLDNLASVQRWFHESIAIYPYACLPSMHVALSVLPACLSLSVLRSYWLKSFSVFLAALITISTVTLKEHYFLDSATGLIFALLFYAYWRWNFKKLPWKH
jgi:membrane-associated phospholipid phosphatase